jgi:two-component system chemotaxis sensor kinase CheA
VAEENTIDKFKQAFQEEAREILVELEASLLELGESPADTELVGRAFRALHTIKGSGSMFGFEQMAAFTHNLENAFDEVRNGRLSVTSELINLSLAALDQIKAMLEEGGTGAASNSAASTEILAKLQKLTGLTHHKETQATPAKQETPAVAQDAARDWLIRFFPGPDLLRNGANPLMLLTELKQLGNLRTTVNMAAIPPLDELDPQRCYIGWDMVLTTAAAREAIRDVFIFVEDSCELAIEPDAAEVTAVASSTPKLGKEKRSNLGRRASDASDVASIIRVPAAKLDQFVDLVGELVTVQARLGEIASRRDDPDVAAVSEEVERLTSMLRESSMSIRMLPIRATFERFRRLVHDLSQDLNKEVELAIEGADTELDKTVIDQLNDPLMHLVRNSMDHGIELAEARVKAGKPRTATLHLSARHSGANVLVSVSDDGAGNGGIERGAVDGTW